MDEFRREHARESVRILASIVAVIGSAALTLAAMIAVVQGTIRAVSIPSLPIRILAVGADFLVGSILLLGCVYLATHLAVWILGVGRVEFPPLPEDVSPPDSEPRDRVKNKN